MQTLKPDIRNRILTEAEKRFAQRGYLKTSMREIADAAGAGVGNLYNYFSNKDELFRAVVRPVLEALERMLQEHHGAKGAESCRALQQQVLYRLAQQSILSWDRISVPA